MGFMAIKVAPKLMILSILPSLCYDYMILYKGWINKKKLTNSSSTISTNSNVFQQKDIIWIEGGKVEYNPNQLRVFFQLSLQLQ